MAIRLIVLDAEELFVVVSFGVLAVPSIGLHTNCHVDEQLRKIFSNQGSFELLISHRFKVVLQLGTSVVLKEFFQVFRIALAVVLQLILSVDFILIGFEGSLVKCEFFELPL